MKLFFPIGAFYPSQIGGPCNTLFWHACALQSKGIEVEVTTTAIGIPEDAVELDKVLEKKCGLVYYGASQSVSKGILKRIVSGIRSSDVVHLNSLFNILSIISFFYLKIFFPKKKIIWSVRGELSPDALKFSRFQKIPLLSSYKMFTKNVLFHSTSEKETAEIRKVFRRVEIIEVPNFIEPSSRFDIPVKKQFLYLGRIHRIKAIHKMIEGFSSSSHFRDSDFKLVIAGKHEERHADYYEEILRMIKTKNLQHKVELVGHVIGEVKERMYAESYALILPSETENFGNVVVEALNQGTPVIASLGTPWSVLEKYQCGFHVSNEPEQIALTVDRMMSLPDQKYSLMRNNAKLLVDKEYDVRNQIDKWIEIYQNANQK